MKIIGYASTALAVILGVFAVTYQETKNHYQPDCATTWQQAKAEDDFCVSYWVKDHVVIGPLSDLTPTDRIVGSPD